MIKTSEMCNKMNVQIVAAWVCEQKCRAKCKTILAECMHD